MNYTDLLVAWHEKAGPTHPVWKYNGKVEGRALAESLGIRVPELLSGPASLGELVPPKRPFVLKPNHGYGGKGVYSLVPAGGGFHRPATDELGSWSAWMKRAQSEEGGWVDERTPNDRVSGPWLIEEAIGDGMPDDWNVWVVGGLPRLVHRRNWDGKVWRHACWDPDDWSRARGVWEKSRTMADLEPPVRPEGLLGAARLVASQVDGPALRIDFYEDDEGVIFGEITPFSSAGRNRFSPEWEAKLGSYWNVT